MEKYTIDLSEIKTDSKIVICGAGKVGNDYYEQLNLKKYNIVLWIDDDVKKQAQNKKIKSKKEILGIEYDYILIAVKAGAIVGTMIEELKQLGVDEAKIIWKRPFQSKYDFIYNDLFLKNIYEWRINKFYKEIEPIEVLESDLQIMKAAHEMIENIGAMEQREWYMNEYKNIAYLHNAKVACTSIKASLKNLPYYDNYSHIHEIMEAEKLCKIDDKNCFKFTYVRNPLARLVSCYNSKYLNDKKIFGNFSTNLCYGRKRYLMGWLENVSDFREFVDKVCEIPTCWQERHFRLQYDLVYNDDVCLVDYIGKFEELDASYEILQKKYGVGSLLHYNQTNIENWENYYDLEMAEKVMRKYRKDIEVFGYEKECNALLEKLKK